MQLYCSQKYGHCNYQTDPAQKTKSVKKVRRKNFCQKIAMAKGQSPMKDLKVRPYSGPYLLVCSKGRRRRIPKQKACCTQCEPISVRHISSELCSSTMPSIPYLHYITLHLRSLRLERFIYNYLVCRTLTAGKGAKPRGSSLNFTLRAIGPFRRAHFGTSYWVKTNSLRLFSWSELLRLFQFFVYLCVRKFQCTFMFNQKAWPGMQGSFYLLQ